jgi:hypothetical protein
MSSIESERGFIVENQVEPLVVVGADGGWEVLVRVEARFRQERDSC